MTETDEARLDAEIREWAEAIPGTVRIGAALARAGEIAGVIRRMTVFPMADNESLESVVSDGTGEVVVRFMGRPSADSSGLASSSRAYSASTTATSR